MEKQEKFTLDKSDIASLLGYTRATINRMVSDTPELLPPFSRLGPQTPGQVARGRVVWLRETVATWLKSKEGKEGKEGKEVCPLSAGSPGLPLPVAKMSQRGRGRPPKLVKSSRTAGGRQTGGKVAKI